MGQLLAPLGIQLGSTLLGGLLGGTQPNNQYLPGFPGGQDFQQQILKLLGGGTGNGGSGPSPLGQVGALAGGQGQVSDLQRLSSTGISQYFNQPAPEQRAMDLALPALQRQLSGTGTAGTIDPLRASYQQNLGDLLMQSNSNAPNRFSSGLDTQNTLLKQRSLNDFNTLAGNLLEQGQQRQLQAAQTLGGLASSAGQNPFSRLLGAGQLGTQQTGQSQQAQLQALQMLLGPVLGSAFGGGQYQSSPSGLNQGAAFGGGLAQLLMMGRALGGSRQGGTVNTTTVGAWPGG